MENEFVKPNGETLKKAIQDYIRKSSTTVLERQAEEQKALISEFMMHMSNFMEQKEECAFKIVEAEYKYQELMQALEAIQKEVVGTRKVFADLEKMYDDFAKGLIELDESHLKQYTEMHDVVLKNLLQHFQQLHEIQQHGLVDLKKKIFSILM